MFLFCFLFFDWRYYFLRFFFYIVVFLFFPKHGATASCIGRSKDTVVKCQKDVKRNKKIGKQTEVVSASGEKGKRARW